MATRTQVEPSLMPLDAAILAELPDEGSMQGFHNLGSTVKHLAGKWRGDATPAQLNGRMRALKLWGYATDVPVQPVGGGLGWQITSAGKKALAAYKLRNGHGGSDT